MARQSDTRKTPVPKKPANPTPKAGSDAGHSQPGKALQETEASLRAFLNAFPEPAYVMDLQGKILVANRAQVKTLGKSADSLIGSYFYDSLPTRLAGLRKAKIKESLQSGAPVSFEETHDERHYINFVSPAHENGGKVSRIAFLSLDITDRKQQEEALRESEEKYRTVVNQANDGIAIIQDRIIKFINPRLAEIGGYTVDEVINRPFHDFLSFEETQSVLKVYESRMSGQEVASKYDIQLRKKNNDYLFAEVNSSIISYQNRPAILIMIRDFTKRKRTEKLKDSVFRISEAAISSDSLDDLFRSIHQVIADLMPAKNFYIALYDVPTDLLSFPYFVDEYDQAVAPHRPGRGLTEYVLRTGNPLLASPEVFNELVKRGEVELIGAPSIDWLGVPLNIASKTIGVLVVQSYKEGVRFGEEEKDILKFVSDQVAMAVHRKKTEAQIKISLEEKDVLLKEVHHRVKNNMQVISSLLNLQSRHIQDPSVLEMFKESQRRIRSMALIHERLYRSSDLSRIEFSQYVRNLAAHLFQSYQVDSSRIRLNMEAEEVFLNINTAIPCGLIVNELISNALKHAFPDMRAGEVRIELRRIMEDGYVLRVKDNGLGFPEGLDFHKTETLGLQIVSTLVNQIDGRIELDRREGTAFTLEFNELPRKKRT